MACPSARKSSRQVVTLQQASRQFDKCMKLLTYGQWLVGTPITYGCIMLDDAKARALFDVAYIGMPVVILP